MSNPLARPRHKFQKHVTLAVWRSSHSNSTTSELRTFSADSKFVEFFHVPIVEFEPQVYTIGTIRAHRPPEQRIEQMGVA